MLEKQSPLQPPCPIDLQISFFTPYLPILLFSYLCMAKVHPPFVLKSTLSRVTKFVFTLFFSKWREEVLVRSENTVRKYLPPFAIAQVDCCCFQNTLSSKLFWLNLFRQEKSFSPILRQCNFFFWWQSIFRSNFTPGWYLWERTILLLLKWSFFIVPGLDGSGKNKKNLIFPTSNWTWSTSWGHVLSLKTEHNKEYF